MAAASLEQVVLGCIRKQTASWREGHVCKPESSTPLWPWLMLLTSGSCPIEFSPRTFVSDAL